MRATIFIQKLKKLENINQNQTNWAQDKKDKKKKKIFRVILYIIGIPFGFLIFIGLLTMTPFIPSTTVQTNEEIWQSDKNTLIANDIITKNENIQYFYSDGAFNILEDGTVLTDTYINRYFKDSDGELQVYFIKLSDVVSVNLVQQGNLFGPSIYRIQGIGEDEWFNISLSTDAEGDYKFIKKLKELSGIE